MVAPLDLLAWLRKGKLLQCFFSVGPKEWSSGPQLFEIFFSLPCMSQKCHGLNRNLFFCRLSFSGVQSVEHMMWHGNFQNMCQQKNFSKVPVNANIFGGSEISRNFRQLVMGAVFISIATGTWIIFFFVAWWRDCTSLAQLDLSSQVWQASAN